MGGWVLQNETIVNTTHSTIVTGAALGLPEKPGRFDIIARNTTPIPPPAVGAPYICLGAICTNPDNNEGANIEPDGIYTIWVTYEQQQSPPGTPVGAGTLYQWNGIGNTAPADSGGYSVISTLWDDAEFSVMLNGTGFNPLGWPVEITARHYEWEEGAFDDYDALPTEPGEPGDPGYLYPPTPLTLSPGLDDARFLTLDWGYSESGHEGFAIFDVNGTEFPSPIALIPDPTIRSWAFTDPFPRNVTQTFAITAYNATKKSQLTVAELQALELNVLPNPGSLPVGVIGQPYFFQFEAEGGFGDYTYEVFADPLPTGLVFNELTGILSGTPTEVYPVPGDDWHLTIRASGPDILDSPDHAYTLQVNQNDFVWTIDPADGPVKIGQTVTVDGPKASEQEYAAIIGDKVIPIEPQIVDEDTVILEIPYPPSAPCFDCFGDCPECDDCTEACLDDLESDACQACMQACLDCLTACLESLEAAEECQQSTGVIIDEETPVTIIVGRRFGGSVPLGTLDILVTNGSGLYRFVTNKTNDTIYTPARNGTTYDVKIPNPGGKTGFIRS